jgi:hypothetical protein
MTDREAMRAALDCLGVGNKDEAAEILQEALDGPTALAPVCEICGVRAWPGQFERHIDSVHLERAA